MKISSTPGFQRTFSAMPERVKRDTKKALKLFCANPRAPSLHVHKLKGRMRDSFALSINYTYRIVFEFLTRSEVVLLDIGTHDVYE